MRTKPGTAFRIASMALLAGWLACNSAYAEQLLNAHYELNVTDQGSTNSVRSEFRLKVGERESLDLQPNTVELSVQPVSDREYDLHVVVTPRKPPGSAARLNETFRGTFGVPLELNAEAGALQVNGAISVVVLGSK